MIQSTLSPERVRALTQQYRRENKTTANSGRRRISDEKLSIASRMIASGKSYKEAAFAVGCSIATLYLRLDKPAQDRRAA